MNQKIKLLLTAICFRTGLVKLVGGIRRVIFGPRIIVLCYHRIHQHKSFPAFSATPDKFSDQLAWFSKRFQIIPLSEVALFLENKITLNQDAIALTFDDGYMDNYSTVLPLLKEFKYPATFFISTDPLFRRAPYWYDLLWSRLENWNKAPLPEKLTTQLPTILVEYFHNFQEDHEKWLIQKILNEIKGFRSDLRNNLLEYLGKNQNPNVEDAKCETMTFEEARVCLKNEITIGGHSKSHPSLGRISKEACGVEVLSAWEELAEAGFSPRYFAYPFGEAVDVGGMDGHPRKTLIEINLMKNISKVELAVTTEERAVRKNDDPFLVPRKVVVPQSLAQIALKLEMLAWQK